MKKVFFFLALTISIQTLFAQKYMTRTGYIRFFSHTSVEDIEAKNNQVTGIVDAETGEMVFKVLMKSFLFQKALMQEHFNEKYVESDKFPHAEFKGKMKDWNPEMLKPGKPIEIFVEGDLTIHGVTKKIIEKGTIELTPEGKVSAKAVFKLRPEDYGIKIPALVRSNIAEIVDVFIEMEYAAMPKK